MRILWIVIIINILPFFANAQNFTPSQIFKTPQQLGIGPPSNPFFPMQEKSPKVPQLETVKPISRNYKERTQAKLEKEERKLIKLAEKSWKIELYLRAEKTILKTFENSTNDYEHEKNITKHKQLIVRIEEELKKAKAEEEISSKKVDALELAVEDSKFRRTE